MIDNEILKLYSYAYSLDFIGDKYYESEKSEREERKTWYNTQKQSISEKKKLDRNFKFTGRKVIIGKPCSKLKARSYVENVIYNQLMKEKRENNKPAEFNRAVAL